MFEALFIVGDLYLLRPIFLLALIPVFYIHWRCRRIYLNDLYWKKVIAPHLLRRLKVGAGKSAIIRPYQLMTVVLVLATIIAVGPSWTKQITPFTEDRAPLIIALQLTPSMLSVDQPPSRLERSKQKIRDLLATRQGARTALIVYSGSAHFALPLTDDSSLIEIYLESLTPFVMPVEGNRPDLALELAKTMLVKEQVAGSVVFMGDGIDKSFGEKFAPIINETGAQLILWGVGTDQGGSTLDSQGRISDLTAPGVNWSGLRAVAQASDGVLIRTTLDSDDIESVSDLLRSHLVDALDEDKTLRRKDGGYPVLCLFAALSLLWFRKGWTVV